MGPEPSLERATSTAASMAPCECPRIASKRLRLSTAEMLSSIPSHDSASNDRTPGGVNHQAKPPLTCGWNREISSLLFLLCLYLRQAGVEAATGIYDKPYLVRRSRADPFPTFGSGCHNQRLQRSFKVWSAITLAMESHDAPGDRCLIRVHVRRRGLCDQERLSLTKTRSPPETSYSNRERMRRAHVYIRTLPKKLDIYSTATTIRGYSSSDVYVINTYNLHTCTRYSKVGTVPYGTGTVPVRYGTVPCGIFLKNVAVTRTVRYRTVPVTRTSNGSAYPESFRV